MMPKFTRTPERQTMIRVYTFSYRRLNYVCATINALKAQTHTGFIHHLNLLGYTKEQGEFVRQVANGDERFVISELANLSQRENLMRILEEMPPDAEYYIRMDDDNVYLLTYETGEFILQTTGEAGNWEVVADGGLILDFWGSGKKASYSCHEGEAL
jgi:hypothetical protein